MLEHRLPHHVRILQAELDRRKGRNPRYSLRAFATLLNTHASTLSRVLAGKQDLSLQACQTALENLKLSLPDARLFIASVAEDRRNRAAALLTRAIQPSYLNDGDIEPKFEQIKPVEDQKPLNSHDVLALEKDFISVMDLNGRFLRTNESIARLLETIPCNLIGERWPSRTFDLQTPSLLEKQQVEVVQKQKELTFEFTIGRREDTRFLRRTLTPIRNDRNEMIAFISVIHDQTWEKIVENASFEFHSSLESNVIVENALRAVTPIFAQAAAIQIQDQKRSFFAANDKLSLLEDSQQFGELLTETHSRIVTLNPSFSAIVAPLTDEKEIIGTMVFVANRDYSDYDQTLALRMSRSLSQALRNSQAS